MSLEDRRRWDERWATEGPPADEHPNPWLREHVALLAAGDLLDVAGGGGRNARFLVGRGFAVTAVDVSVAGLRPLRGSGVHAVCMDLDAPGIRAAAFDTIVCVSFLDRRLFPDFARWLRPGGVLLLDTFLIDQREIGHPRNPDHLLGHNELLQRLGDWRVVRYREGEVVENGTRSFRASAVAIRPG